MTGAGGDGLGGGGISTGKVADVGVGERLGRWLRVMERLEGWVRHESR